MLTPKLTLAAMQQATKNCLQLQAVGKKKLIGIKF
jgi:hypothetical protein